MNTHTLSFIQDLAIIMLLAGIITVLCKRFKQPAVLGYILAGIIIGPHTPPFAYIQNPNTISTLAELGVIFLLFSLGLEFDLQQLKKVGLTAFVAASLEIIIMMLIGYELGLLFGWSNINALFLGAILAISSTTIIVKALEELGLKGERFAQLIFGILIIEDIFAIAILTLLTGIALSGSLQTSAVVHTTLELFSFLVISLVLGILLVPRILDYIAKFKSREMLLISVLGLCFGFCLLVIKLNYSVALGAFVIGVIIAESKQLKLIEQIILSLRDMFSAIFFVSVGLLFNPKILTQYYIPVVIITLVVIFGKIISCSLGTFLAGSSFKTSTRVGMGLAQIGEFSFIIAALGINLKVTNNILFPIAVAVSAITTFLTPYLLRSSDYATKTLIAYMPKRSLNFFRHYTKTINKLKVALNNDKVVLIRRNILHIIINFFIITAIFLGAVNFLQTEVGQKIVTIEDSEWKKILIWTCCLILVLPFLIAIYRRIKSICHLFIVIAEIPKGSFLKKWLIFALCEFFPILCLAGLLLLVLVLSSNIMPSKKIAVLIGLLLFAAALFLYPILVKFHTALHIKFLEGRKPRKK